MLKMFDTRAVQKFAADLAGDLGRRFPPASEKRTDRGAQSQLKDILDNLAARAAAYHDAERLGVYKKAKLANVFRWKLVELGYTQEFVDRATNEIATRLAARRGAGSARR